ncbi:hypothetical protein FA15DRAFT_705683 [Coprinopsis marcescibilis]|uniref:Uncharacterized protein n=1 Tax=Coprinopsis marcescibilis TaxID=230819 RepID=A0A5C3KSJ9_COPMA|nr:hypothetical protein FA15DRAFT_705683 [Coprinopsis marcescibilis]
MDTTSMTQEEQDGVCLSHHEWRALKAMSSDIQKHADNPGMVAELNERFRAIQQLVSSAIDGALGRGSEPGSHEDERPLQSAQLEDTPQSSHPTTAWVSTQSGSTSEPPVKPTSLFIPPPFIGVREGNLLGSDMWKDFNPKDSSVDALDLHDPWEECNDDDSVESPMTEVPEVEEIRRELPSEARQTFKGYSPRYRLDPIPQHPGILRHIIHFLTNTSF